MLFVCHVGCSWTFMDVPFPREGNFTDSASTGAKFGSPSVALQNDVVTALLRSASTQTHTHTHTFLQVPMRSLLEVQFFVLKTNIEYMISINQSIYIYIFTYTYMWLMYCRMPFLSLFLKLWLKKSIWGFTRISAVSPGVVRSSSQTYDSQPMCEGVCRWMRTRWGGTVERFWPTSFYSACILQYFAYCSATRSLCSKRPMNAYSIILLGCM